METRTDSERSGECGIMERREMCFKKEGLVKQDKDREVTLEFDITSHCYKSSFGGEVDKGC